ncbi:hypothetical protein ElyMa_002193700 [Elysia marginata]|uniref:Uncharacterized protein n=1 Tax=Elysia marginata TaxID=1093978 RepID=A0AAV4FQN1_9GAST|nr:hypothetical protein ElyMa_002193700 [Elysia marginata]
MPRACPSSVYSVAVDGDRGASARNFILASIFNPVPPLIPELDQQVLYTPLETVTPANSDIVKMFGLEYDRRTQIVKYVRWTLLPALIKDAVYSVGFSHLFEPGYDEYYALSRRTMFYFFKDPDRAVSTDEGDGFTALFFSHQQTRDPTGVVRSGHGESDLRTQQLRDPVAQ